MTRINVAVLRGGPSSEYEVSMKSGAAVLKNMPEKYQAHDIWISREGLWHREGFEKDPERALAGVDVVLNAMHGDYGEDGRVQRLLNDIGIAYAGSDAISSALAMNKVLTKKAFEKEGIKTPYYMVVNRDDDVREKVNYAFHHFLLPIVVKPVSSASSNGVSVVNTFLDLEDALRFALQISQSALIEEFISGKEASCAQKESYSE